MTQFINIISKFRKELKSKPNIDIILLFFLTLVIYVHNLSPSVFGTDSGDFLTAALAKGVPHPSGYPLYTILGIIFLNLPFEAAPAWKMGLISALSSSVSVVLVYLISKRLTKNRYFSILAGFSLAFLLPFWLYSEVVEVFALHYTFILLLIYITIIFFQTKDKRNLYYLAFFTGLSLTNNMSIVLLFPSIIFLILITDYKFLLNIKFVFRCIILFIIGLSPYIYIPIAASFNPLVNWGKVVTLDNFLYLVLRKQYGWGVKTDVPYAPLNSLKLYINYWKIFVDPFFSIFAVIGSVYLLIKRKFKLLIFLMLAYIFLGPLYAIQGSRLPNSYTLAKYGVLERFYIPSFLIAAILVPLGFSAIKNILQKPLKNKNLKKYILWAFLSTLLVIPIASLLKNFEKTNLGKNYTGDNLGYDILKTLPENSILLSQDDNNVFNALYVQMAYNIRPDVYIPGRHDSLAGIAKASGMSDIEIEEYVVKNKGAIENSVFLNALPNMLRQNGVFSDFILSEVQVFDNELGKIIYIPYGLVYKLYFESTYKLTKEEYLAEIKRISSLYSVESFRENENSLSENINYSVIKRKYAIAYYNIADFIAKYYNDRDAAKEYLQKGLELDPLAEPNSLVKPP